MQKTLDILEKNVQWLALGLGGVFLLWVVWAYIVTPPATVTIDRKPYGPGDVSELTANGPVRDIQNQIDAEKEPPAIAVADVVTPWQNQMTVVSAPSLPPEYADSQTKTLTGGPVDHQAPINPNNPLGNIASLPQLPKAQLLKSQAGLSVVRLPQLQGQQANAQQAAQTDQDKAWVSEAYTISAEALKAAFATPLNGHPIPPGLQGLYNTTLLQAELQRQRAIGIDMSTNQPIFPQGDQGVEDVPEPATVQGQVPPLPAENAPRNTKYQFIDWAQKNQDLVAQPPFYQVMAGDSYESPQAAPASGAMPPPVAQPLTPAPAPSPAATPATPPASSPAPPRSLFGPRTEANAPAGFAMTDDIMSRREDRRNRIQTPPPAQMPGQGFNAFANPGANNQNPGTFNPLEMTNDLQIWGHDDSVKPGETYRYRVVYKLKNPLFGVQNVATRQVTDEFVLVSPPSDWGQPVVVPRNVKFWVNAFRRDGAQVDIYNWVSGKWTHKRQTISPGDQVPGTDWTLVDVRGTGPGSGSVSEKDKYVLLTDDAGSMIRRSVQADSNDPDYKATEDAANPNKPAAETNGRPNRRETNRTPAPPPERRDRRQPR